MKLVTYSVGSERYRLGALRQDGSTVLDLATAARQMSNSQPDCLCSMQALIESGEQGLDTARELLQSDSDAVVDIDKIILHAPLPRPVSVRDCLGFSGHFINMVRHVVAGGRLKRLDELLQKTTGKTLAHRMSPGAWQRPLYYFASTALVGHGAEIEIPAYSQLMDYELEWAACIGKKVKNLKADRASESIFGYTIFNDFTARDTQMFDMKTRFGVQKSKSFDGSNVMGPCLVTRDEIPDPYNLSMWANVNGIEWSRGSTAQQDWSFEEMIEYLSSSETLEPGEMICSGTVPTGSAREMGREIVAGDTIELNVQGIGTLTNTLVAPMSYQPLPVWQKA